MMVHIAPQEGAILRGGTARCKV